MKELDSYIFTSESKCGQPLRYKSITIIINTKIYSICEKIP